MGCPESSQGVSLPLFDDHIYTGTTVSNSIYGDPLRNHCQMYGCVVNLLMRGIYDSTRVTHMHFCVESAPSTLPVRLVGTQEIKGSCLHNEVVYPWRECVWSISWVPNNHTGNVDGADSTRKCMWVTRVESYIPRIKRFTTHPYIRQSFRRGSP